MQIIIKRFSAYKLFSAVAKINLTLTIIGVVLELMVAYSYDSNLGVGFRKILENNKTLAYALPIPYIFLVMAGVFSFLAEKIVIRIKIQGAMGEIVCKGFEGPLPKLHE